MQRIFIGGPATGVILFVFLIFLFVGSGGTDLRPAGPVTAEQAIQRAFRAPATRVRQFHPARIKPGQYLLRVDRREMALSRADLSRIGDLDARSVQRIDYVTSRCGVNVAVVDDVMDRRRITALFNYNKSLFSTASIQWGRIVQTACQFEYQSQGWFHGFVVTFAPTPAIEGIDLARLKHQESLEFTEGDMAPMVRRWNAPGRPAPPRKFKRGTVTRIPFDASKHFRKRADGYALSFPEGGWMPAPTLCGDKLLLSGGFKSSSYHAFDLRTGRNLWSVALSDNGPGAAVCKDGAVLFNTISCTLFALDESSGRQLWSHFLGDVLTSTPVLQGDRVYTSYPATPRLPARPNQTSAAKNEPTHVLSALALRTGKILWQRWIDSELVFAPVPAGDDLYATSMSGVIYRFDLRRGRLRAARRGRATAPPLFHGGRLWITRRVDRRGDSVRREALVTMSPDLQKVQLLSPVRDAPHLDRKIMARLQKNKNKNLRAEDGSTAPGVVHAEAAWVQLGRRSMSGLQAYRGARPVLAGDIVVSVVGDRVFARNTTDGSERWTIRLVGDLKETGEALAATPVFKGGDLYLATLRGVVLRIEADTGRIKKTYSIGAPMREPPLIVGNRIFAATTDGQLVMTALE